MVGSGWRRRSFLTQALYCCCRFLSNWDFYFVVAVVVSSCCLYRLLPHYLIQNQWDTITYPHCFCFLPLIYVSPPPIRFLYFCVSVWHTNKRICHHMYFTVSPILFFVLSSSFSVFFCFVCSILVHVFTWLQGLLFQFLILCVCVCLRC